MIGHPPLVPPWFDVPRRVEADRFVLVPLTWRLFPLDFECYMSSVQHLQATFDLDGASLELGGERWPANSDLEFAHVDAAWCQFEAEHLRSSFTYVPLTPAGDRQLGAGYIFPSKKAAFRVECQTWVRADEAARGFDAWFYRWFRRWVEDTWPFRAEDIGWPGREIPWEEWNELEPLQRPAWTDRGGAES
ncbi:MAG: hypothetical protein ACFCVG_03635 [Kineosporiaceae bacterium]